MAPSSFLNRSQKLDKTINVFFLQASIQFNPDFVLYYDYPHINSITKKIRATPFECGAFFALYCANYLNYQQFFFLDSANIQLFFQNTFNNMYYLIFTSLAEPFSPYVMQFLSFRLYDNHSIISQCPSLRPSTRRISPLSLSCFIFQ